MKKVTNEEKVLQFLIDNNLKRKNNVAVINPHDVASIGLSEDDIIKSLYILQTDGCLVITRKSPQDEFDMYWEMNLTSKGRHYFEHKAEEKKEKRNKWIQFWIPVGISALALIISTLSLLLDMQQI